MNDQHPADRHAGIGLPKIRNPNAQAQRIIESANRKMQLAIANHEAEVRRDARKQLEVTVGKYQNELDRLTPEQRQHVISELISATDTLIENHLAQLREVFRL